MDIIYTVDDLPYIRYHKDKPVIIWGLFEGEPTEREIYLRKVRHINEGWSKFAIMKICPACDGENAEWIRGDYCICYDCELVFEPFERYYNIIDEILEDEFGNEGEPEVE